MCYNVAMKTKAIYHLASVFGLLCAFGSDRPHWRIDEDVDRMSDRVTYILHIDGDPVAITPYLKEPPSLVLQITPTDNGKYFVDVLIRLRTNMFSRNGAMVDVRFDKGEVVSSYWKPSQLRDSVFAPNPNKLLPSLRNSKILSVRYVTSLDYVRATSFRLSGLNAAIADVKRRVKARKETPVD